jgi:hypothetical protein
MATSTTSWSGTIDTRPRGRHSQVRKRLSCDPGCTAGPDHGSSVRDESVCIGRPDPGWAPYTFTLGGS